MRLKPASALESETKPSSAISSAKPRCSLAKLAEVVGSSTFNDSAEAVIFKRTSFIGLTNRLYETTSKTLPPSSMYTVQSNWHYTVHHTELQGEQRIMSMEYSGSGDPTRTMALLWGAQKNPSRGPKPSLSVEQIVRTAIELADTDGVAALSMRRLADGLGVSTMSLYTYVPSKAELIDVMLDAVLGEAVGTYEGAWGWTEKLEVVARENWALYHR